MAASGCGVLNDGQAIVAVKKGRGRGWGLRPLPGGLWGGMCYGYGVP